MNFLLFFLSIFVFGVNSNESHGFYPDNVFSRGNVGYGPLLVDSKSTSLYVGARGQLFRLWLFNINQTSNDNLFFERKLETRPEDREDCLAENSATDCETID
uniref:Uncharacterized protein n=1 Tax=Panagrolaimus sp. JU765 TaxID=591449 RepID=A0AC34QF11_9BILA